MGLIKVRKMRAIVWTGLASVLVLLSAANAAQARILGCPTEVGQHGNKIVIASVSDLVGSVGARVARAMLASFEMKFERAGAELGNEAAIIYCQDRLVVEGNYRKDDVSVLNDERVLLEVGARPDGDDIRVTYVVIPIRHYQFFGQGDEQTKGYHDAIYEKSRMSAGLQQLFKGNAELRLMAALALALRYEKLASSETNPDDRRVFVHRARAFYCDAIGSVAAAKPGEDFFGLQETDWEALSNFAKQGASRLFTSATSDGAYASSLSVVASERAGAAGSQADCLRSQAGSQQGGAG